MISGKAAPIFRSSDERLYGSSLVKPFESLHNSCIRTVSNPIHPGTQKTAEYARRIFKAIIGFIGMVIISPIALIGKAIQVIHYHVLSKSKRDQPETVSVNGISLPKLKPASIGNKLHGTDHNAAKSILRSGFKLSEGSNVMGQAIYVTDAETAARNYGQVGGFFRLEADLDSREIAKLDHDFFHHLGEDWNKTARESFKMHLSFSGKFSDNEFDVLFNSSIRQLFLKNGYRGVEYQANVWGSDFTAMAIYDPSCLKISKFESIAHLPTRDPVRIQAERQPALGN